MIQISIDVNVKGLEALEGLLNLITSDNAKVIVNEKQLKPQKEESLNEEMATLVETTVPTVPKPAYEFSDIQKACAALIEKDPNGRDKLKNLLNNDFGVTAVVDIPKEQYNDLVIKLRNLGGAI